MTNFAHGRAAEQAAAEYLEKLGYKIIDRNWRTRWCEIDIVAEWHKTVYFVEVKYRVNIAQGSGLEYITPRKLAHMGFADQFWVSDHGWTSNYQLAALELSGPEFSVTHFLPDLTGF